LLPLDANAVTARQLTPIEAAPSGPVETVELANAAGMRPRILTLEAAIQAITVPDRIGKIEHIALGYATPPENLANPKYFGVTVGRYANRIAAARFSIDGATYKLGANNGPNSLHGGLKRFDQPIWGIDPNASNGVLMHRKN